MAGEWIGRRGRRGSAREVCAKPAAWLVTQKTLTHAARAATRLPLRPNPRQRESALLVIARWGRRAWGLSGKPPSACRGEGKPVQMGTPAFCAPIAGARAPPPPPCLAFDVVQSNGHVGGSLNVFGGGARVALLGRTSTQWAPNDGLFPLQSTSRRRRPAGRPGRRPA